MHRLKDLDHDAVASDMCKVQIASLHTTQHLSFVRRHVVSLEPCA